MPPMEISHRRQYALLWAASGVDKHGQHKRAALSVELQVRWDDSQTEALDPNGNTITVDATAIVNRDIPVGSIMWQGSLRDLENSLPGTGSATTADVPLSGLMEVVTFDGTKDIKGRCVHRRVGLKRYGNTMPASV